jgi:hypothetical protein
MNKLKLNRETVSLEKIGKKRKAEVLRSTENDEWEQELKEFTYAGHYNVCGGALREKDDLLPPPSTS